jgi:outer membrane lipoprotein SlyB
MSTIDTVKKIHPLVAGAAVAVILVSIVGVAAMTGMLPNSNSEPKTESQMLADSAPKAETVLAEASTPKEDVAATVVEKPKSVTQPKKVIHKTPTPVNAQQNDDYRPAPVAAAPARPICDNCGVVESVRTIVKQAEKGSGLGAAAGAILGGVLGHQVGGGRGKDLATVAGVVGGGLAGNEVEKRNRTSTSFEVRVKMENGDIRTFTPATQPDWRAGDHVRIIDGNLSAN